MAGACGDNDGVYVSFGVQRKTVSQLPRGRESRALDSKDVNDCPLWLREVGISWLEKQSGWKEELLESLVRGKASARTRARETFAPTALTTEQSEVIKTVPGST